MYKVLSLLWVVLFLVHCGHSHKKGMTHDFSDAAKWAQKFDDPKRDQWQKPREVVRHMKISRGMKVADIGAGTGYFLPHLNSQVGEKGQVMALEVEPSLIKHMNTRIQKEDLKNTMAYLIDYDNPQLENAKVNRVLIVDTWHHISNRKDYAKKIRKGLEKNGKIFVVDFEPGKKGPGPSDKHRLKAQVVVKELVAVGFKAKVIQEALPYQYIVVGSK